MRLLLISSRMVPLGRGYLQQEPCYVEDTHLSMLSIGSNREGMLKHADYIIDKTIHRRTEKNM